MWMILQFSACTITTKIGKVGRADWKDSEFIQDMLNLRCLLDIQEGMLVYNGIHNDGHLA